MQFLGKFDQIIGWHLPSPLGLKLPSRKSSIRACSESLRGTKVQWGPQSRGLNVYKPFRNRHPLQFSKYFDWQEMESKTIQLFNVEIFV